jgi:hypothetical protein
MLDAGRKQGSKKSWLGLNQRSRRELWELSPAGWKKVFNPKFRCVCPSTKATGEEVQQRAEELGKKAIAKNLPRTSGSSNPEV